MKNKSNKIYTVFNYSIVNSDSVYINAIQGYDVIDAGYASSLIDAINMVEKLVANIDYIMPNRVYKVINPNNNDAWYINRYFIAINKKYADLPVIIFLKIGRTGVISCNWKNAAAFLDKLQLDTVRISPTDIGYISTPQSACINIVPAVYGVKFPLTI